MSELGETFKAMKEEGRRKRGVNLEKSRQIIMDSGLEFKELSDAHLRVGEFDFWPSTGLFVHTKTKKRGRGVFNLIRLVNETTRGAKK